MSSEEEQEKEITNDDLTLTWRIFTETQAIIRATDTKAQITFAFVTAIFTISFMVMDRVFNGNIINYIFSKFFYSFLISILSITFVCIGYILLFLSVIFVTLVLYPRVSVSPCKGVAGTDKKSALNIIYFEHISSLSGEDYFENLREKLEQKEEFLRDLADQIFSVATIAHKKLYYLKWAHFFLFIGLLVEILSFGLLYLLQLAGS